MPRTELDEEGQSAPVTQEMGIKPVEEEENRFKKVQRDNQ